MSVLSKVFPTQTVPADWAADRDTDFVVAIAIHAVADHIEDRTAQEVFEDPSLFEVCQVMVLVDRYVRDGDYPDQPDGYRWDGVVFPATKEL